MAIVLDTTYQILVLKIFLPRATVFVVMVSAILPYLVVRSAISPLMRRIYRTQANPANSGSSTKSSHARETDH